MEKDERFKLFMPPRPSAGQVSAGRSQGFNKCPGDLKLPFDVLNRGEITDSDTVSQQVKLCSEVDEENTETSSELFSKLYKEAEKIKEWKVTMESELNQKERKLQENRKIIEAQNKLIQELQCENEKLNLKLEDEIGENKDLLKEAAASRHLCNLLKETCTHFTEKTSKYEQEKEAMKQLYEELHSNIERMTVAFDELRIQSEKDRLEMSSKLKEEAEKVEMFEKECKLEVSQKEKQISALTMERDEKDGVIKDIKAQLQTSQTRIADLMAAKLQEEEMLKGSQVSQEHLRAELEEAKISLQKAEVTQQNLEAELQSTVRTLIHVTAEKEAQQEECEKMKVLLAALREEFEISAANLKSLLQNEQNRLKKYEEESKLLNLELQNKSAELEEVTKAKCDKEEELTETLKEFKDLKVQLAAAAEKEQDHLKQLLALKTDLEQDRLKNDQLTEHLSRVSLEKEQTAQEKNAVAAELRELQEKQEDNKKKEENTKQLVEHLKEENDQLRNELESWEEKMAKESEEMKRKLDEKEENMNSFKKQVEKKSKCIEELQQENKVLRKKLIAESKKSSFYEEKVNKLQLEMENMNKQHKETVDTYQKEIEARKVNENKLQEEVEKMRLVCDEATMTQREAEVRCQHRVTELLALMEKHKNEYDKMVEEKDAELKVCKIKQQKQQSSQRALEKELSRLKSELSSLKEQLRAEIEEKENLVKEYSLNVIPENEKKHEAQGTNPPCKGASGSSTNPPAEQSRRKKPKVFVPLEAESGSSEHPDLLSIVSEEEIFKKFHQDHPQTSQSAPKKTPPQGSALKLKPMRRIRDSGWATVSKLERKRKMKEVMKFFA